MAAKVFEVDDILPQTTQLKISWDGPEAYKFADDCSNETIKSDNNSYSILYTDTSGSQGTDYYHYILENGLYEIVREDPMMGDKTWLESYGTNLFAVVDTTALTLAQRTISFVDSTLNTYTWEDLNAPSGFSITFEENGGTTVTDLTEQTNLPDPMPTPTKANNVFAGWYYDALFTQKAVADATIESNVTLYAKWYTPTSWVNEIADSIREKEGSSEPIRKVDFADRIRALNIAVELTQAQYDGLGTKDSNTYYLIVEEA